jgi:hypothetical protein
VNSSWVEPAALCTAAGEAAFWVGLDGADDGTVEQTGTTADCFGGTPVYFAWYELFPAAPIEYSDTVAPGDNMSASVTYTGSGAGLSGGPVTAYSLSAGGLWTATPSGASDLGQTVMAGTSPSVAALPGACGC